jgi:hypothetical protein
VVGAAEWAAVASLCLALSRLAELGRRHARRHRMRLISWRWDQIASYRRHQTRLDRAALKVAEPVGQLTIPLTVLGLAAAGAALAIALP